MDARPVLLLDFDGVLNVRGDWEGATWDLASPLGRGTLHADGFGWPIRWAPGLVARLVALHASGRVDIRWCSTWIEHGTAQIEDLLGLPPFPHAYALQAGERHSAAKARAALGVVAEGRPLIWADDDAIPFTGPAGRLRRRPGVLLLEPSEWSGLRPSDLDAVDAFLTTVASGDAGEGR